MVEPMAQLDEGSGAASPVETIAASREDSRPKMPEPPPVSLVAVQSVRLPVVAGLEHELDTFYRDQLRFERVDVRTDDVEAGPVYRAENHDVCFFVVETPDDRQGCRPLGIITPHYSEIVERLDEQKAEYEIVRGIFAGTEELIMRDPAGNWIALIPLRDFR